MSNLYLIPLLPLLLLLYYGCLQLGRLITNLSDVKFYEPIEMQIGYSLSILLLNYLYLILNFKIISILYLIVAIFVLSTFINKIKYPNSNGKFLNSSDYIFILILAVFFVFIVIYYGPQFYVFRGNHGDWFNYLSSAEGFKNFNINQLNFQFTSGLENQTSYKAFKILSIRPAISLVLATFLLIPFFDSFLLGFYFKIFLIFLIYKSYYQFLDSGMRLKKPGLAAVSFGISFWIFYVFEIDALSSLAELPLFISFLFVLTKLVDLGKVFLKGLIPLVILLAANWLLYPEVAIIIILVMICAFIFEYKYIHHKKNSLFVVLLFLLVTIPFYESTYLFLLNQAKFGVSSNNAWWGYFDGFLLGSNSPIRDPNYISFVKGLISQGLNFNSVEAMFLQFSTYLIYILPSLFGFYYLTNFNFLLDIFILIFSLVILFNSAINFKNIFKNSLYFYFKPVLIVFLFMSIFLLFRLQFWAFMKLFFYFCPFLFLVFYLKLDNLNLIYGRLGLCCCILSSFFVLYKYSEFNFGIGRSDSMPSILKMESKINNSYNFNDLKLNFCSKIFVDLDDPYLNEYVIINLTHMNIPYFSKLPLLDGYGDGKLIAATTVEDYDCRVYKFNRYLRLEH